jgi:hypothetical protein
MKQINFINNMNHYLIIRINKFQIKQISVQNYKLKIVYNYNLNKIILIFVNKT